MRQFVLQAYDLAMGCPMLEARLRIDDLTALRRILDTADDDPEIRRTYFLDPTEVDAIGALSRPPFRPDHQLNALDPWHPMRGVPYLVHTGFELPLMLEGRKPLAAFIDDAEWLTQELSRFDPFVQEGRLVRRAVARGDISEVYFVLPGQEWRIDAYIELYQTGAGWDDARERRQGELLGYKDWQNDWWMANRMSLRVPD